MKKKNFFITTPIYYVNSSPHIGHAYTNLIASALKRWFSISDENHDVMLLTGTDEHGQKIEESARKAGQNTKEFIDFYSKEFKNLADKLMMPYDDFIRTSEDRHKKIVIQIWNQLLKKDFIYLGQYSGWYAPRDEAFYKESEIKDGLAPSGAEVFWREEEAYFFKLSKFQNKLLDFFEKNPDFIKPSRRANEILNFVQSGLEDLCISRKNFKHGIAVPDQPEHTIYVWIDALANYISALEYGAHDEEKFKKFWPQKNSDLNKAIHVIGKDISRFHAVYWPAMLFALDLEPPSHLLVHGWWLNMGQKISKSLGNVIDPLQLIKKFGADYVSYFFLSEIGFDSDGDFSEEKFAKKINSELVNNFGNLISRVTNMSEIYFDGKIEFNEDNNLYKNEYKQKIENFWIKFSDLMNDFKFSQAISELLSFSSEINLLIDDYKPWKIFSGNQKNCNDLEDVAASDEQRKIINDVFFVCLKSILTILSGLYSFIPEKTKEIFELILKKEFLSEKFCLKQISEFTNFEKISKINIFKKIL
jgi:methionyl-tRNA synthetase